MNIKRSFSWTKVLVPGVFFYLIFPAMAIGASESPVAITQSDIPVTMDSNPLTITFKNTVAPLTAGVAYPDNMRLTTAKINMPSAPTVFFLVAYRFSNLPNQDTPNNPCCALVAAGPDFSSSPSMHIKFSNPTAVVSPTTVGSDTYYVTNGFVTGETGISVDVVLDGSHAGISAGTYVISLDSAIYNQ